MKAYNYIRTKQIQWALNHNIPLIGSKRNRGRLSYTDKLDQNLFEPLQPDVKTSFLNGNGNEIRRNDTGTPYGKPWYEDRKSIISLILIFFCEYNTLS